MQLLLVDADLDFRRVLSSVLSGGGIRVDSHEKPGTAWTSYTSNPADLVMVDVPPTTQEVETFLRKLREDENGARVPLVLMSQVHHSQSTEVSRLLKEHEVQAFLTRPFELFGITDEIKRLYKMGGPSPDTNGPSARNGKGRRRETETETESVSGQANRSAFRLLKDIWLHKRTGVLRSGDKESWALICDGGLQSASDVDQIEQGLLNGSLEFQQTHQDGTGDVDTLGLLLWHYANKSVPVSFEMQLDRRALQVSPITERAQSLPLNSATKKVLKAADPHLAAAELIRSLSVLPQDVVQQLGALKALGLLDLAALPEMSPGSGKRIQSNAPRAMAPTPARKTRKAFEADKMAKPAGPSAEETLARLKDEHSRLKNADDHTILGIAPGSPDTLVRSTSERLMQRYDDLYQDDSNPKEVRVRARMILRLTQQAEKRILTGREIDDVVEDASTKPLEPSTVQAPQTTEELAYSEGTKAFSTGNYKRAIQCFKKARDERIDSARNLAWLGWAIFHNEEIPTEERIEESLDTLRLASTFDPQHRQGQFFLAFAENETGQTEQAEKRLKILLKKHADHKEAKKLLFMIQKKKK